MKNNMRRFALGLSLLAMLLLLPLGAAAAGSIDQTREVHLTVSCQADGTPLTGAQFDIFLVGLVDTAGNVTVTERFARYPVVISTSGDADWKTMATTLEGYVRRDGLTPTDSTSTNSYGMASFPSGENALPQGLYLVLGQRHTQNGRHYDASPFLVLLPTLDSETDAWAYEVIANAKYESSDVSGDSVQRKVLKVWDDAGHESKRPDQIVVQLLRNGDVYDTVVLNAGNNWRHTWTGLSGKYSWLVVEKELDGYTVEVTPEGTAFVVTNTYTGDTPDDSTPEFPQTGQLWWPVPVLLFAGLTCVVIGLVRRRGSGYDTE